MTKDELSEIITHNFYENFAKTTATIVIDNNLVEELYQFATNGDNKLPDAQNDKLIFRAAYVLEIIFFEYNNLFKPYINRFFVDFTKCKNGSAKRHFTKIMTSLLRSVVPQKRQCEAIAEQCAEWAIDPKVKIAVKIWAIEVLRMLKPRVDWIEEVMPEILEPLTRDPLPSIECRLKRWKQNSKKTTR